MLVFNLTDGARDHSTAAVPPAGSAAVGVLLTLGATFRASQRFVRLRCRFVEVVPAQRDDTRSGHEIDQGAPIRSDGTHDQVHHAQAQPDQPLLWG